MPHVIFADDHCLTDNKKPLFLPCDWNVHISFFHYILNNIKAESFIFPAQFYFLIEDNRLFKIKLCHCGILPHFIVFYYPLFSPMGQDILKNSSTTPDQSPLPTRCACLSISLYLHQPQQPTLWSPSLKSPHFTCLFSITHYSYITILYLLPPTTLLLSPPLHHCFLIIMPAAPTTFIQDLSGLHSLLSPLQPTSPTNHHTVSSFSHAPNMQLYFFHHSLHLYLFSCSSQYFWSSFLSLPIVFAQHLFSASITPQHSF